ncbi:hypothetical protein NQZ68_034581 [Dissostichus eleginoides]|nr:hypothetical protein NQZ68_034581 [Dissostichus eleginoides]
MVNTQPSCSPIHRGSEIIEELRETGFHGNARGQTKQQATVYITGVLNEENIICAHQKLKNVDIINAGSASVGFRFSISSVTSSPNSDQLRVTRLSALTERERKAA